MNKKTVGKVSSELLQKQPDTRNPIELERELQKDYMTNLIECVNRGFKRYNKSFFIEVITKQEPLLENVFRNYFVDRKTCPTPNYDQSVFRYNNDQQQIEYIWSIPSQDACHYLKNNAHLVVDDEKQLLSFVLQFDDGTLYRLCKKYNGEKMDSLGVTLESEN